MLVAVNKMRQGFTLVELLVVMAILAILAGVGFGQYHTSQQKARDAQRKADLSNIARALEMYYNDHRSYPLSVDCAGQETGKIIVSRHCPQLSVLNWGDAFKETINNTTIVYMKRLPQDPSHGLDYCYQSDGTYFKLFSVLENTRDPDYNKFNTAGYRCHDKVFNFGVASSNVRIQ